MIALSSSEAEYIALSNCGKDIMHLRRLFREFQVNGPVSEENLEPTILNTDSTCAMSLVTKPKITERNKHIEIKAHHIKELVSNKIIKLHHTSTYNQPADILTKPVQEFVLSRLLPFFHM